MGQCDINWRKVITDLEGRGMSLSQQAIEVGAKSKSTVYYWKEKSEPSFSKGLRLLEVYKTVIGTTDGIEIG